ncbi:MAG: 5-oxoprolinase subunit PxpA [Phycisphaerales bacterium JB050]
MKWIDLNCDIGEATDADGIAREAELVGLVSRVNIACGGHAGDAESMRRTVLLALEAGCAIGAHPSYPDREHFGRKSVAMDALALEGELRRQIERLAEIAEVCGGVVGHVKAHGALYHDCARDEEVAGALARAAGAEWLLVGGAGTASLGHWRAMGRGCMAEAFADRVYEVDGRLRARTEERAVIMEPGDAAAQAVGIARDGRVQAHDGTVIEVEAGTICVHGDTPGAVEMAKAVREAMEGAGIGIGRA